MIKRRLIFLVVSMALAASFVPLTAAEATHDADTLVSVGSDPTLFSRNKQNEPAIAVDPVHPNVLAAGANDNIDNEACNAGDDTTCPFTPGVGGSGIYFSFDSGDSWTQPEYTGYSARNCIGANDPPGATPTDECNPQTPSNGGLIGTLPWYYENGLVSDGDPAVAFGPKRGSNGTFAWSNGIRLYYANLTANFGASRQEQSFKGFEAIGVSRLDGPPGGGPLTQAWVQVKNNWLPPVIASKQSSALFADKEQIWADNAETTSPFFGNVYICLGAFRGQKGASQPLIVATSRDGGGTWENKQVTAATNNTNSRQGFGRSGCTVRTDSKGVVYVFAQQFAFGSPGIGSQLLIKSFDGGRSWTKPRPILSAADTCNAIDPVIGRCVEDGVAGARDDLGPAPSVDIANGAPTGADATDQIALTWVDGRDGLNHEHVVFTSSADGGQTWAPLRFVEQGADRGYYSAPAISPNGTDVYLVYNAFLEPYKNDTRGPANDRPLVGVILHADVANKVVGSFQELHRSDPPGDARASSQQNLQAEFLGDYVYAVASRSFGAAVWNDVRNGADCPAVDVWRMSLRTETTSDDVPTPEPNNECAATFGNTDIFGWSGADPTP